MGMYSNKVKVWNEVMDNHPRPTDTTAQIIAKIKRQSAFVVEEANEIQDGANKGDIQEILDGYLDTKFTNDQIGVYLEALGVDIVGAWGEVCRSNNTKFSNDEQMMQDSATELWYRTGSKVSVVESPVPGVFVLKREHDGKIMKPECFKEPRLRPFIPKQLRRERK